jgi:hypothetical protein
MNDSRAIASLMEPVARMLLGEPSNETKNELRYGTYGSVAIDLRAGTWFDHERGLGGGVVDLIKDRTGQAPLDWLDRHGLEIERARTTRRLNGKRRAPLGKIVATYRYRDEGGAVLSEVVRFEPKNFRQRRPDPNRLGEWIWSKGERKVPYRLPDLIEQLALRRTILIVEGEKDVDNLWRIGVPATCNAGGAGKWSADLRLHHS